MQSLFAKFYKKRGQDLYAVFLALFPAFDKIELPNIKPV